MDHISWRTRTPEFIPPVLLQLSNICWAIAFVRQFEMQLKMENLLSPHQHLSIQELVNIVPFRYRRRNGTIFGIEHAARFLRSIGTVLDEACPLTYLLNTRGRTQHPGVIRYKVPEVDHHYLVEYFAEYEEFGSDVFEDVKPLYQRILKYVRAELFIFSKIFNQVMMIHLRNLVSNNSRMLFCYYDALTTDQNKSTISPIFPAGILTLPTLSAVCTYHGPHQ